MVLRKRFVVHSEQVNVNTLMGIQESVGNLPMSSSEYSLQEEKNATLRREKCLKMPRADIELHCCVCDERNVD
jgi:hypothetical protein